MCSGEPAVPCAHRGRGQLPDLDVAENGQYVAVKQSPVGLDCAVGEDSLGKGAVGVVPQRDSPGAVIDELTMRLVGPHDREPRCGVAFRFEGPQCRYQLTAIGAVAGLPATTRQLAKDFFDGEWSSVQSRIQDHLGKADCVPVDVSGLNSEQVQTVQGFVDSLGNPSVFIVGAGDDGEQ